jgi:hypothetical protein
MVTSTPAATVMTVEVAAITIAAPRGVVTRASAASMRFSTRVSAIAAGFAGGGRLPARTARMSRLEVAPQVGDPARMPHSRPDGTWRA